MNAYDLAAHLQRGGAYWYLYLLPQKTTLWAPVGRRLYAPSGSNTYFSVNPTFRIPERFNPDGGKIPSKYVRAGNADIAAINGLYGDFDARHCGDSKAAALAHIQSLRYAPSVVIDSDGGFHVYWLLGLPWVLDSDANTARNLYSK